MPPARSFTVVVPGDPRGRARSRSGAYGHHYTDSAQEAYDKEIVIAWIKAGRPVLPDGPYACRMVAYMRRNQDHYGKRGALTPEGLRALYPTSVPDIDNLLKQVDALVGARAIPDDAKMVKALVSKEWAHPRGSQRLVFSFATLVPESEEAP